ncbi:hypothetical protein Pelo_1017 [Pelomyxa schiedti]|nr:hypothetical protein Pelo_1017 [Pelomyxa schiedti]
MTLNTFTGSGGASYLGSMLFSRNCSGVRVQGRDSKSNTINSFTFANYGAHTSHYHCQYLTMACAIGTTRKDIDTFMLRLQKTVREYRSKHPTTTAATATTTTPEPTLTTDPQTHTPSATNNNTPPNQQQQQNQPTAVPPTSEATPTPTVEPVTATASTPQHQSPAMPTHHNEVDQH